MPSRWACHRGGLCAPPAHAAPAIPARHPTPLQALCAAPTTLAPQQQRCWWGTGQVGLRQQEQGQADVPLLDTGGTGNN
jgi:hypothetical protein